MEGNIDRIESLCAVLPDGNMMVKGVLPQLLSINNIFEASVNALEEQGDRIAGLPLFGLKGESAFSLRLMFPLYRI